ncbi:MAG: methionyl-tRNA formyltransferase [Planctomycetes bacterium]|nr:methionyl-tRNA formyltransferase [Planctomycetota bacterium]
MKITFLGSGAFGLPCLNAMQQSKHELVCVITQPAHGAGRGRKLTPTPVSQWAASQGIECLEMENVNTPEAMSLIASRTPDLLVVIAFGQKIGQPLIESAPHQAINVHASVLPALRGAAPINWAILKGHTHSGVSIITLADRIDAGDVLATAETPIGSHETAGQMHERLAEFSAPVLMDTLDRIEAGTAQFTPQNHDQATFASKLKKSDGYLDFSMPASEVDLKIRGLSPWPGAQADYRSLKTGKTIRVTLGAAQIVEKGNPENLTPGTLDQDLDVVCGSHALRLETVKPSGKPLMAFKAFVNGRQCQPGDVLTTPEKTG